jgi:hypothetical protein
MDEYPTGSSDNGVDRGRSIPEGSAQGNSTQSGPVHGSKLHKPPADRGSLILVLGILSLFLCWPLGLLAWVLGSTDLKRIARGEIPAGRVGLVKAGRILGILGTFFFVAAVVFAGVAIHRHMRGDLFRNVEQLDWQSLLKRKPLPLDQIAYAGAWRGEDGTVIVIFPDGTANFRTGKASVTGAAVRIEGDHLSIGILGFSTRWQITEPPHMLGDGNWQMKLEGVVFSKKGPGQMVHAPGQRHSRGKEAGRGKQSARHWAS